ncbi:hypothetical protein AB6Q56_14420 [Dechloromonas sp. ARDL1]|uniref:hypothetical protein n=1 Tax=Dechloromonas sp. ARDL1 TaxID=3322121 RepID=UPI003DA73B70
MANLGPPAITGNTLFDRWCQLLHKTVTALPVNNVDLSGLQNFANDAAAATGGVKIGGMYRNGSVLMVRVS